MISHKHKFIFIHAPKTAGNSIQNYLQHYSEDKITINKEQSRYNSEEDEIHLNKFGVRSSDPKFRIVKHTTLNAYYNNWRKKYGSIEDFFKFGTARNPWDRAISGYFSASKSFDKKRFINNLPHYTANQSCADYFYVKKYNKLKLDYVVRFENLQEDFDVICDKIGTPRQKLPHANKSKHKHYTEYYDDETRQIVSKLYKKDIEHFGYEFGE
jgi:hypothetical protein